MKPKLLPRSPDCAFTIIELLVVIVVTLVLASLFVPIGTGCKQKATRITCVYNLKQLGTAYRYWAGDHQDLTPFQREDGFWLNFSERSSTISVGIWSNFYEIASGLEVRPNILNCPTDERKAAVSSGSSGVRFSNTNISYFVGSASDALPEAFLGGDRNLAPGPTPSNDYGFSPADGQGADVILSTNGARNPLVWSLKMHSEKSPQGAGNLLMGDGSVQQCSSARLMSDYLPSAGSWPPSGPGSNTCLRLIFP